MCSCSLRYQVVGSAIPEITRHALLFANTRNSRLKLQYCRQLRALVEAIKSRAVHGSWPDPRVGSGGLQILTGRVGPGGIRGLARRVRLGDPIRPKPRVLTRPANNHDKNISFCQRFSVGRRGSPASAFPYHGWICSWYLCGC